MTKASRQRLSEAKKLYWANKRNGGGGGEGNGSASTAVLDGEYHPHNLHELPSILSEATQRAEQTVHLSIPLQDVWTLEDLLSKEVGRQATFTKSEEDISKVSRLLGLKLRLLSETKRVVSSHDNDIRSLPTV